MRLTSYLIDGGTEGISPADSFYNTPKIEALGPTSLKVTVDVSNMDGTTVGHSTSLPTKYIVKYANVTSPTSYTNLSPDPTTTEFNITGLTEGASYNIEITPYFGVTAGGRVTVYNISTLTSYAGNSTLGTPANPKKITGNEKKGYLTLSAPQDSKYRAFASRSFPAITVPSPTQTTLSGAPSNGVTYDSYPNPTGYNGYYYSFGASLFLSNKIEAPSQGGGVGFFADSKGNDGYYILVNTIPSAIALGTKSVRIIKVVGGAQILLKDSQQDPGSTLDQISGGTQYYIDAKVKVSGQTVDITAYINGFKITATDKSSYLNSKVNKILRITNNVAIVCTAGTVNYDYVYGKTITEDQYKNSLNNLNFYQGQFSNDLISTSYGDVSYFNNSKEDNVVAGSFDEFGTVAREVKYMEAKYNAAFPIKWSTGLLKNATIASSTFSPFKGEAYVLNNTSNVIPLADDTITFGLFGNTLGKSGAIEYTTGDEQDYKTKEPVVFESKWLQSKGDVESLGQWIKQKVINRGKIVTMSVFGNPLIEVGDIITIKYTYHNFDGTQKLIVTNVNHSFSEGLDTTITCRTL